MTALITSKVLQLQFLHFCDYITNLHCTSYHQKSIGNLLHKSSFICLTFSIFIFAKSNIYFCHFLPKQSLRMSIKYYLSVIFHFALQFYFCHFKAHFCHFQNQSFIYFTTSSNRFTTTTFFLSIISA